jgi:UDPglucose 6-dehydrogenase
VYDPIASERARELLGGAKVCESADEALEGADAAVLVTEWPEFRDLDWFDAGSKMRQRLVVDGRNFLDGDLLRRMGFTYEGVGR